MTKREYIEQLMTKGFTEEEARKELAVYGVTV